MASVDGDHASAGSVEIGLEPEDGTVVVDEDVLSVEVVEQLHDRRIRLREVFVVEAVLGRRALRDADDQVVAVIGDVAGEYHLFVVGALVDEFVFGLRGAEAVIVELLKIIGVAQSWRLWARRNGCRRNLCCLWSRTRRRTLPT